MMRRFFVIKLIMASRDDGVLWVGASTKLRPTPLASVAAGAKHHATVSASDAASHALTSSNGLKRIDAQHVCSRLLSHVLTRELGGTHNATGEHDEHELPTEEEDTATALQLAVELSRPTQSALATSCTYVLRYSDRRGDGGGLTLDGTSATFTRVSDDVTSFRKALHTCWSAKDVVGGLTDGLPTAVRDTTAKLVGHGLRGEQPIKKRARDEGVVASATVEGEATDPSNSASTAHLLSLLQDSDDDEQHP